MLKDFKERNQTGKERLGVVLTVQKVCWRLEQPGQLGDDHHAQLGADHHGQLGADDHGQLGDDDSRGQG